MAESSRISRRRNIMIFTNRTERASFKTNTFPSYDIYSAVQVGAVEAGLAPDNSPVPTPGVYNLAAELLRSLNLILNYAATNNLGPTKSSRIYYLWFFSVATAYQWVKGGKRVSGTKDDWNWETQYSLDSEQDVCIWMLTCLTTINAGFPISYTAPWDDLRETYLLTSDQLTARRAAVESAAQYNVWSAAYSTWFTGRAADGNVAASVPPADSDLPNGATRLDVALTVDPATFPSPESWTPLKIGASSQKYMTYNWNSVRSPSLIADDQTTIYAAANAYYPTSSGRQTEIGEVVSIANGLTDDQKVIAEFWAGGPFTVSPPGMLIWMWKYYVSGMDSDLFVWSGLDLSLHLFETGRIVWGLKKAHMEARPIQEIRRLYRGQSVKKYDGTTILGESWVPYQETNFVTPPFADFPSGHSAFSRSFANVMNAWFGPTINNSLTFVYSDISLISPALESQTGAFGSFEFGAGASEIQAGTVPAEAVTLSWTTWNDMADSAGISRKYGGIHATSAHTGSVAAADALHTAINTNFPIAIV
jgi:hypothetical protein